MKDIQTDISRTPQTDFKSIRVMVVNLETRTIKRFSSVSNAAEYFGMTRKQKLSAILKGDGLYTHEGVKYKFEYLRN